MQWPVRFRFHLVVERIVFFTVQKTGFNKKRRHLGAAQNHKARSFFNAQITETEGSEGTVDIFRHGEFDTGFIINQCLHAVILSRLFGRVSVKGDKEIRVCPVGNLRLLKRSLIDIRGAGINDIDAGLFQQRAYGHGQGKVVVLFLPALIYGSRVTAPVTAIEYNSVCHNFRSPENTFPLQYAVRQGKVTEFIIISLYEASFLW